MVDRDSIINRVDELLGQQTPRFDPDELKAFVKCFLDRREIIRNITREHGSPLYLIDKKAMLGRSDEFSRTVKSKIPDSKIFYAVKSNNNRDIVKLAVKAGLGLDVSSGEELKLALDCGATEIIFSGPGKTEPELKLAVANRKKVTILLDSFGELNRLEKIAAADDHQIRTGVRLTTDEHGLWRKFGIPLSKLEIFFDLAEKCHHIQLAGLQFHTSWNLNPSGQVKFIEHLGKTLNDLSDDYRFQIEFIDIGGGYWPAQGEWLQNAGTPEGQLQNFLFPEQKPNLDHYCLPGTPLADFIDEISRALAINIFPRVKCTIFAEPGRWISHDSMHLLLQVIDRKSDDLVITDGGMNIVGWERYEMDYFPVINLSRPSLDEHPCLVLGSLCTPHDVWGYSYFGADIKPGDYLLIPAQGAYTYSLRQNFIKSIPRTAIME